MQCFKIFWLTYQWSGFDTQDCTYGVLCSVNFYVNRCMWSAFLGQNMQIRSIKFESFGAQMLTLFTDQPEIWHGKANLWCAIKLHRIWCIVSRLRGHRSQISPILWLSYLPEWDEIWYATANLWCVLGRQISWLSVHAVIPYCRFDHSFSYQGEIQLALI